MFNLMTESFERIRGRYPGESGRFSSVSMNGRPSSPSRDPGLDVFFKQVAEIDKEIERINGQLGKLQAANDESKHATKASVMKEIKERMERDIEDTGKIALKVKKRLETLDGDNLTNRRKPGCGMGTGVDRTRTSMTVALKQKLKERMSQFQALRETIHEEYREVIQRRIFTVTGTRPDEEMIDNLIETGNGEQIFAKAIQSDGRGQVMDTLAEIQERHDTVFELEKKLLDLQQTFMDMAVLVDSQGELLNDIEAQVESAVDHVQKTTVILTQAKAVQKNTRKYTCFAVTLFLIIIIVIVFSIKNSPSGQSSSEASSVQG